MRFLCPVVLMLVPILPVSAEPHREAAGLLLRRAYDIWLSQVEESPESAGFPAEAARVLDMAGEFMEPGADASYLKARRILASPDTDGRAGSMYRRAYSESLTSINPSSMQIVPFRERALLFASLALRLREYESLTRAYEQWPSGERRDAALTYAASRAAFFLGDQHRASEWASLAEAASTAGDTLPAGLGASGNLRMAARALSVTACSAAGSPQTAAAVRRWGIPLVEALKPWMLAGFLSFEDLPEGILSPEFTAGLRRLERARMGMDAEAAMPPAELAGDLAFLTLTESLPAVLAMGYTGTLSADSDYDGFPEEWLRLVNGRPDSRRIDADQDGVPEWNIVFVSGEPAQIRLEGGKITLNYESEAYPDLLSMTRRDEGMFSEYSFLPGGFSWAPASAEDAVWKRLRPPRWTEDHVLAGSRRVSVIVEQPDMPILRSTTLVHNGRPYLKTESVGTGMVREILFEEGLPAAGRRSYTAAPAAADGTAQESRRIWDVYERYENGRLVGLAWDPGMLGRPVYAEDRALEPYLFTQIWDINRDGWTDSLRFVPFSTPVTSVELSIYEADAGDLLPWTAAEWEPWNSR